MDLQTLNQYGDAIYYALVGGGVFILAIFSYLAYLVYQGTVNTEFVMISYIVMAPVVIAAILLILLILLGKKIVSQEVLSAFGR